MGFWIISFEILLYLLFFEFLISFIYNKNWRKVRYLFSTSLFGLILEYANVFFMKNYHYSTDFLIQIGKSPYNIPIVIAMGWGIIIETVMSITARMGIKGTPRAFLNSLIGLSIDFVLDIVVVRLDGGFWVWHDIPMTSYISFIGVCGINWGNFYGWFCVVLIFSYLIFFEEKQISEDKKIVLFAAIIVKPLIATLLLFGCYYIFYPFAFMANGNIYIIMIMNIFFLLSIIYVILYFIIKKPQIDKKNSFLSLSMFISTFIYYLLAIFIEKIYLEIVWFLPVTLLIFFGTLFLELKLSKKNH